jgi:hypothetical protein
MSLVILHCINTMIIYTINIIIQILIFDSQLILTINNLINGQCASVPKLCDNNVILYLQCMYETIKNC